MSKENQSTTEKPPGHIFKDMEVGCRRHYLDSGSFTLWRLAGDYHKEHGGDKFAYYSTPEFWSYVDSYCKFIKVNTWAIDHYSNVDVIPNAPLTWRNQQYMEKKHGLKPIPVIHYKTEHKWINHYIDRGYKYIAFGGLVGSLGKDECKKWVDEAFTIVCNTPSRLPKVKVHGFGLTNYKALLRWPWYCMTEENHTVLTKTGWKELKDLQVGQEIMAFDDGDLKWQPILEIPIFNVTNAPIYHIFNKKICGIDAYVTGNHWWRVNKTSDPTFKWKRTNQLSRDYRIPRTGNFYDFPKTATYSDAFVELVAWYWTEGTIRKPGRYKKSAISIYQSSRVNPQKVKRIRNCLNVLEEKYCVTKEQKDGCVQFQIYGESRDKLLELFPNKELNYDFILTLTESQLHLFIDVSMMADGHVKKIKDSENLEMSLRQKGGKNIDQLRFAGILAGYVTSVVEDKAKYAKEVRMARTRLNEFARIAQLKCKIQDYTGKLWCVRVESQAFLTKCNERVYVTGNSCDSTAWMIHASYGFLDVPHLRKGTFDFTDSPYQIFFTDRALELRSKGKHFDSMTPKEQSIVRMWLDHIEVPLGSNDKQGDPKEFGVRNYHAYRSQANQFFFEELRAWMPSYPWPFECHKKRGLLE